MTNCLIEKRPVILVKLCTQNYVGEQVEKSHEPRKYHLYVGIIS